MCGGPLTYFSPCHAGCSERNETSKIWNLQVIIIGTSFPCICFLSSLFWFPDVLSCDSYVVISFQGSVFYSDCACVAKTGKTSIEAKKGICAVDCGLNRMIFLSILGLLPFMTFLNDTPGYIVTLRFVLCN